MLPASTDAFLCNFLLGLCAINIDQDRHRFSSCLKPGLHFHDREASAAYRSTRRKESYPSLLNAPHGLQPSDANWLKREPVRCAGPAANGNSPPGDREWWSVHWIWGPEGRAWRTRRDGLGHRCRRRGSDTTQQPNPPPSNTSANSRAAPPQSPCSPNAPIPALALPSMNIPGQRSGAPPQMTMSASPPQPRTHPHQTHQAPQNAYTRPPYPGQPQTDI